MTQHINVLFFTVALIAESDYECAFEFVKQKELMQNLSSLMQVSDEKSQTRRWINRLIKGASMLVSSLASVKDESSDSL